MRSCLATLVLLACTPSVDDVLDPETCASCHPTHVEQWSGSMHALASDDPIFRAMNALGQRETDGALGDFCVQCHAPLAVQRGLTVDGSNLDDLPASMQGVTCAACHRIDAVTGPHNGAVRIAQDALMRGGILDPVRTSAHRSAYSPLHDRDQQQSADLCIGCHDVTLDNGLDLETTGLEWRRSLFSDEGPGRQSCGHCHMRATDDPVTSLGTPERRAHDHRMAAIDVALRPAPDMEGQRAAIQTELDRTLLAQLCVLPAAGGSRIVVQLENAGAGHHFPSGSSHSRRIWVALRGEKDGQVVFERGQRQTDQVLEPAEDTWLLHDQALDRDGEVTHFIHRAAAKLERALPMAVTNDPSSPDFDHAQTRTWILDGVEPDRVTMEVRVRPVGLDVLDELIATGDLDPSIRQAMPTFRTAELEWSGPLGSCVPAR